jgi:hypothetical protein
MGARSHPRRPRPPSTGRLTTARHLQTTGSPAGHRQSVSLIGRVPDRRQTRSEQGGPALGFTASRTRGGVPRSSPRDAHADPMSGEPRGACASRSVRQCALRDLRDRNDMDQGDLPISLLAPEEDRRRGRDGLLVSIHDVRLIEHEGD